MDINYKYTNHQVARGTMPDAIEQDKIILIKSPDILKLTYQIKLCTYMASQSNRKLVIHVANHTQKSKKLRKFIKDNKQVIIWKKS